MDPIRYGNLSFENFSESASECEQYLIGAWELYTYNISSRNDVQTI